jgi:hypothetical protein
MDEPITVHDVIRLENPDHQITLSDEGDGMIA